MPAVFMPGRRPKPTALKELAGNPGHRPLNDEEPQPDKRAPEMPKGMARAARREWARIVPVLLQLGVLSEIDGKALAGYCDAYAMWEEARREIHKYGQLIKTPKTDKEGNVIVVREDTGFIEDMPDECVVSNQNGVPVRGRVLYELKANPAVGPYNTYAKLMKSYLIEFGLTPASRSKLKIQKQPPADPMANFLGEEEQQAAKVAAPLYFKTGKEIPASAVDFEA